MIAQHIVGTCLALTGVICSPHFLGFISTNTAGKLIMLSGLIEISWEWEDFFEMTYRRWSVPKELREISEPWSYYVLKTAHHSFGLMCIPMNLYYTNEYYYWALIAYN